MIARGMRVKSGLRLEEVGDQAVVFDRVSGESVHRVSGDGVLALRAIGTGVELADIPETLRAAVDELLAAGILEDTTQMSRRQALSLGSKGLLAGGAVWSAATVTTFALADPAAAATPCTSPGPTSPQQQKYTASTTFITDRGVTSLKVRVWGAGGGGGAGNYTGLYATGSGGGGGAYAYTSSLTVTPCTAYTVSVGAGGAGGPSNNTDGSAGGDSYFDAPTTVMAKGGSKGLKGVNGSNLSGGAGGSAASSVGATTKNSGGNGGQSGKNSLENNPAGGGGGASDGGGGGNGGNHNSTGGTGGAAGTAVAGGAGSGSNGGAGAAPGGGGASSVADLFGTAAGGAGARGQVWIGF
jgi:hypothetical protein